MYFNRDGWAQGNNINAVYRDLASNQKRNSWYDDDDIPDEIPDEDDDDDGGAVGSVPSFRKKDDVTGDKVSFKGAIMAEPTMNDYVGIEVLGNRSNVVYENAMDFDMAAFYPSIKTFSNMDPITLIGKAAFDNEEFIQGIMLNRSLNQAYEEKDKNGNLRKLDHTGEAINTFLTGNILTFGYNWLGLPSVSELLTTCYRELK
jgi:hypothetical protein